MYIPSNNNNCLLTTHSSTVIPLNNIWSSFICSILSLMAYVFIIFLPPHHSAFYRSPTSTAGCFPLVLPQAKSLLSGVASDGGWLWLPSSGGKVQALQDPLLLRRGVWRRGRAGHCCSPPHSYYNKIEGGMKGNDRLNNLRHMVEESKICKKVRSNESNFLCD